jgi:hypothetical protein
VCSAAKISRAVRSVSPGSTPSGWQQYRPALIRFPATGTVAAAGLRAETAYGAEVLWNSLSSAIGLVVIRRLPP